MEAALPLISSILRELVSAGMTGDALVCAVERIEIEIEQRERPVAPTVDDAAEKRRAYDRERKRKAKEEKLNSTGNSTGNYAESVEFHKDHGNSGGMEAAPSLSLPPNENISNPLTHTYPDIIPARESQANPVSAVGEFEPDRPAQFGPDDVQAMWNLAAKQMDLPKAVSMSDTRRKHAQALIRKHGRDGFTEAIAAIERSAFLRGDNDRGWKADIDFLLQSKSFLKLIEGSYDRSSRAKSRAKYEPEGAIAHLHRRLGNSGNHEAPGSSGPSDDGWSGSGDFLPYS